MVIMESNYGVGYGCHQATTFQGKALNLNKLAKHIYIIVKIFKIFILLSNWGYWKESRQSCSVSVRRGLNALASILVGLRGHNQLHGGVSYQ